MQGVGKAIRFHGSKLKHAVLQQLGIKNTVPWFSESSRFGSSSLTTTLHTSDLENTTVAELLKSKGDNDAEFLYWCQTDDTMTQHNVGALVVVKPGEEKLIAGIVTERDYLKKIIVQGRSSKSTRVGEIMTDENKLITVSPDTNILKAMQLMTEKRIRHVPVMDKKMVGMISIVDVVRTVVDQQREEVKRLNELIRGDY
ncbi:hypothetical protein QJS10_CPA01g01182 [Acorus calamus]|uniref:CBS domain-containing protein n=1 Tax=Acorus calamus TaxID=4465 RepID=A0AAV9FND9_ACOCL|nr:hypothetical protein QJS10_CPA01g01182 [Acorus calamus]